MIIGFNFYQFFWKVERHFKGGKNEFWQQV